MNINAIMRHGIRAELAPSFEPMRNLYCSFFERGWDVGSSFTAFYKGKKVVHITGGFLDPESNKSYKDDTLQMVGSASKFVETACVGMLVDRGYLTYDTPISKVWPEFGKYGKQHITLRQLMAHRAGLCYWGNKLTRDQVEDKKKLSSFLSELSLNWAVPTDSPQAAPQGYHSMSRGMFTSEICHRVDPKGRYMNQFLQEEPLGIEITFGQPSEIQSRISPTHHVPGEILNILMGRSDIDLPSHISPPDPKDPFYQLDELDKQFLINHNLVPSSAAHRSVDLFQFEHENMHDVFKYNEFPSSNATTNSYPSTIAHSSYVLILECYSLAALASVFANAGTFIPPGRRYDPDYKPPHIPLVSPQTVKKMIQKYDAYDVDKVIGTIIPFTHGGIASFSAKGQPDCYGWGGAGGVCVRFFPEMNLALAYVPNRMGLKMSFNDPRSVMLITAMLDCIKHANKSVAP